MIGSSLVSSCTTLRAPGEESFRAALRYCIDRRYLPGLICEFSDLSHIELVRMARILTDWDNEQRLSSGEAKKDLISWPRDPRTIIDRSRVRLFLRIRHGANVIGTSCVPWKPSVDRDFPNGLSETIKMKIAQSLEVGGARESRSTRRSSSRD